MVRNVARDGCDAAHQVLGRQKNIRVDALQVVLSTIMNRIGYAVVTELKPIMESIATSHDGAPLVTIGVSVTLRAADHTLVVSVRNGAARDELPQEAALGGLDARQLGLVNRAIDENLGEPISVSMLSSIAGLSRLHFSHAFRRSVGQSPHDHIVSVRIERAMQLMLDSDASLSEVALRCGFCDQAHYANTFRRIIGMTPTEWRRMHLATDAAG